MTTVEPPKRISDRELHLDVSGYLAPFMHSNQPAWMQVDGAGDALFIALFSTEEKLLNAMKEMKITYEKIVQIEDSTDFLESVALHARVIVDPYIHTNGRVRFTELLLKN